MLNLIATDLQLYNIFKITRISCFWHAVYILIVIYRYVNR